MSEFLNDPTLPGAPTLPTTFRYTGQRAETGLGPSGGEGLYYYGARWYDSQLGRFAAPDSIIPGAGNVQAWDRYAGMLNNPVRYTDPSGHAVDPCRYYHDGYCAQDRTGGNRLAPWQKDENYDPKNKKITDWGDPSNRNNDWDKDRAEKVWSWICSSGGWWGSGCPSAFDLVVWLFAQEVGILLYTEVWYSNYYPGIPPSDLKPNESARTAALQVVTFLRDILNDGIDPRTDLAKFTAFFNPNSGGSFDAGDWEELMTEPHEAYLTTVNDFWNAANPYPGAAIVWWTPGEANAPGYNTFLYDVTNPKTGEIVISFGMW